MFLLATSMESVVFDRDATTVRRCDDELHHVRVLDADGSRGVEVREPAVSKRPCLDQFPTGNGASA